MGFIGFATTLLLRVTENIIFAHLIQCIHNFDRFMWPFPGNAIGVKN